jgi:rSAM/selenodomain-associated transferase 1
MHEATICIFAKPPRPGEAKTRLAPAIGHAGAARVATALLEDVIDAALQVPRAQVVISATESFSLPGRSLPIWPQPEGDLGIRIEHTVRRALLDSKCAIAVGADTPGITTAILEDAVQQLRSFDAVLGPAEDGGYYLAGFRRCPRTLLAGIRWSNPVTLSDTRARLQRFLITCALLPKWFDLDTPDDLARVRSLLAAQDIAAPHLQAVLDTIPAISRETVV